jgi:acyl-CoA thioester hydrolase
MQIRIYYEDTDAGGIVYHTNYIKYCERARSELFFEKGLTPTDGEQSGFVVKNINADFLGMAMLGDMVEVKTELVQKKNSSIILEQSVIKEEKVIFKMQIVLVFVRKGRPARIPESMVEILG